MKKLKKGVLEFIPVFLGVVLALFLNILNENRIDRNKIDGLLDKIALGTEKNIENLKMQLSRNQRAVDSLTFYMNNTDMRITDILSRSGGIRYIQFDLAAWNVLKSSELLIDVDYDRVSLLYLLDESIVADSNTIPHPFHATDRAAKEEFVSDISDYMNSTEYRLYLCEEIQKLLKEMD